MTAPQTGGGSGSSTGAPQGGAPGGTTVVVQGGDGGSASRTERRADAVQGIVDRLVTKYGTLEAALQVLANENFEHRESLRTLNEQIATLTQNQVPKDATVLSGDDKKAWDAITAAKIPVAKIVERVKRADELEAADAEGKFAALVASGAQAVKYNPTVLQGLLKDKGYVLEMRDVSVDGKTSKLPYVRKANDDKGAWELLTATAEQAFKDYLPALKTLPQGGGGVNASGGSGNGTAPIVTTPIPSQSSSGSQGDAGGSAVDQQLAAMKKRAERPNPLRPAAAK